MLYPPPFLMKLLIIIHNLVQKKPGILPEKTNKQKKEVHQKSEVPKNIIICDWLKFSVHCNF